MPDPSLPAVFLPLALHLGAARSYRVHVSLHCAAAGTQTEISIVGLLFVCSAHDVIGQSIEGVVK